MRRRPDPRDADPFTGRAQEKARIPFEFVLDALEPMNPTPRKFFGTYAIYVGEKFMLVLCENPRFPQDQGVWVAAKREHVPSLRKEFPVMRPVSFFENKTDALWQNVPADSDAFEETVLAVCERIVEGDPRIGKVPAPRRPRSTRTVATAKKPGVKKGVAKRKPVVKKAPVAKRKARR